MRRSRTSLALPLVGAILQLTPLTLAAASLGCSAGQHDGVGGSGGQSSGTTMSGTMSTGMIASCDICEGSTYVPCEADGKTPGTPMPCMDACAPKLGCVQCFPNAPYCVGNEVHNCNADGTEGDLVEACDVANGLTCDNGQCVTGCQLAQGSPSNIGCEFWAVDLDQQDKFNDPASAPWGVVLSNASDAKANVTIQINEAAPGEAPSIKAIQNITIDPKTLTKVQLPTRELDCGTKPNDYKSPGTCLSSRAFRIVSSAPIVVYQFNVFENAFSNDASLLLPTNALGQYYRVLGWEAGHPIYIAQFGIVDRSYMTIVGAFDNTHVTVNPSWRVIGNPPIAATGPGGTITATLNKFDVLNLETDNGTMQDDQKTIADFSGSLITSDQPVAVFSGTESTGAPGWVDVPKPPGWDSSSGNCCLDHLEDQLFPAESIGVNYLVPRSPLRSHDGFREADVIRFVGVAEDSNITTSLPAPFDSFTLKAGEVKTTYTQDDFTATGTKPFEVGQILVSQGYTSDVIGDPSLTIMPPVEQFRSDYLMLTPGSWSNNYIAIALEQGANVLLDGASVATCPAEPPLTFQGKTYQTYRCAVNEGSHALTGDKPFGIVEYGYGSAGSYAVAGGADVKKIYEPPK